MPTIILAPLVQKYGEQGAEEVFKRWSDCFTEDGQDSYLSNYLISKKNILCKILELF